MHETQDDCLRCGTCCTSGGPALHSEDKKLVVSGKLPMTQLITIRKGELAHNPLSNTLNPVKRELVKVSGVGRSWNCCYFDPEEKGCTIYDKRPTACKALKCWDTEEVEALIETDTISRLDIIGSDDPLRPVIIEHEAQFPCFDMRDLAANGPAGREAEIEALVNAEIDFRNRVVATFDLSLGEELFYFGRPLFHLLISIGVEVREFNNKLVIAWPSPDEVTERAEN